MKHYHIVFIAALIGSLSTSCKIGKKYTRPELNLPTTIIDTNRTDTTTVADIQWPAIYTDTVLQRLINTALAYNKNLLAAAARVKESRYAHRMEKANLFPGIDADALGAREYDRSPGNTFNIEATLSSLEFTSQPGSLSPNRGRRKGLAHDTSFPSGTSLL